MEKKVCESKTPITDLNMLINQMSYAFNACEKVSQNSHRIIHTAKEPFECDVCKETFSQEVILKRHMKLHTLGECYICKRKFSQQNGLKVHMRIHTGEKPFECNICKKKFSRTYHLKAHNMSMHEGEKPFECNVCMSNFSQELDLKAHMKIHTSGKRYRCDICKRKFYHPSNLKAHLRIHTGEKPFECIVCKRTFSQLSSLKVHLRSHTGEKPFECNICKKRFKQACHLRVHNVRIHTCEKPYECDICKKKFSHARNMKTHMKIHTVEQFYQCIMCKKKCSDETSLRNHVKIHVGEKPWKSRDDVIVSSRSLEGSKDTPRVNHKENVFSCLLGLRFGAFDNCSDHRGESCESSEECVDEFVGNDCQVKKGQINACDCKYCGEKFEGLRCKNLQCLMTSRVTDEDTKDCGPLERSSMDSFQDLSVKEEIDIHEISFEDLAHEELENYGFKVETMASIEDSDITQTK